MQTRMKSVPGRGSRREALTSNQEASRLQQGERSVGNSKALSRTGRWAEQSLHLRWEAVGTRSKEGTSFYLPSNMITLGYDVEDGLKRVFQHECS